MFGYGIACLGVFLLSCWAHKNDKPNHADAVGASALLCLSYGISNLSIALYGFPDGILVYPVLDLCLALMVWRAWARRKRWWKLSLMALLVSQMVFHVALIMTWKTGALSTSAHYFYALAINLLFIGELIAVAFPGGRYGVGYVRTLLSRWRHHPAVENVS